MNKNLKREKLKDFSDYISEGMVEVGRDNNLEVDVVNIVKQRQGKMPDSLFVLQAFAGDMSKRENYSNTTFRVLMYFFSLSQYENFVSIDVKTISENMNLSERSVMRATKQLTDDNIIIKIDHPSDKRRIDYFINPKAAWKGKTITRDKFLKKAKDTKMQLDMFKE
jgi:DNA-binding MarR family transcriptional regulator